MTEMALDLFSLKGRRALVTGASRGIGRAIALGFASCGADIVAHYNSDRTSADSFKAEAESFGGTVRLVQADLSQPEAAAALCREIADFGAIDIVVLNAAVEIRRPLAELDREIFEAQMNANFWSSLEIIKALIPGMIEAGWGRLLAIGSVQQLRPNPKLLVYSGLKSAISTAMRSLARQNARYGVTANTLAPGLIETDRIDVIKSDAEFYASVMRAIPAGEAGLPRDCVGAALLLCSEAGRYITGIDLFVDGGMQLP